jgi:hypothetical protein
LILQEVGSRQPEALTSFLKDVFAIHRDELRNVRFQAEYRFRGLRGWRRADLAVFREDEDEPFVLVEIKYFDKPMPETEVKPAQLADYAAWKRRKGAGHHVLLLSRELYRSEGIEARRWDALTRHLRKFSARSELVAMLIEYLEEEGNAMQDIDGRALTRYLKRLLCNKPGANNLNGPVEFAALLKNVQLVSGVFHGHFKTAWRSAGLSTEGEGYDRRSKVASIDFELWNRLKPVKNVEVLLDDDGRLWNEYKNGGTVFVFARHSLGHAENWMRVRYGMLFEITPENDENNPPKAFLRAEVRGRAIYNNGLAIHRERKIDFVHLTDSVERYSEKIETHLSKLILDVVGKTLDAKLHLNAQQKKALSLLKRSLSSNQQPRLLDAAA